MPAMPESLPPIDFAGRTVAAIEAEMADRPFAPVERWHPAHCGDSEMRIARDGRWYHQGVEIGRPALVRQFSRILRREADGSHVLVTPGEKLTIEVELAAFLATAMTSEGEGPNRRIALLLNSGEALVLGPDHPLRLGEDGVPLVTVRGGLEALIARPVYYELAEFALAEGSDPAGVWSGGLFFPLAA